MLVLHRKTSDPTPPTAPLTQCSRNVVRQARGQRLRGEPSTQTPTIEEARKWKLFHDTPLSKKPRPVPETPIASGANSGPDTPWKTPKFEVSSQRTLKLGKTKEFALNVHKEEFKGWLSVLKKNGSRTTTLRRDLVEKLAFPTELILTLYNKKVKEGSGHAFDSLMKCFSHDGFTTHYKILVPAIKYPTPHKFRRGEIKDIDLDAVRQQADGCCKFCRGFAWAGQAEEREIEKGAEVPCHSWHKSVKPYTAEENAEFSQHKYDMLFRRWCRESRYDWIFETPKLSGSWEIPKDDPRLRHITMLKQQHKTAVDAPKLYDADLISSYNELRAKLSKQDIAARIMIEAIRRENPPLARTYERMDLERRRKQVKIDWLCVKQVKVIVKSPPKKQKPTELVPLATKPAKRSAGENLFPVDPEKSAKRVKFASEPEGPTTTGQKTPSKGILKTSNSVANKQTPKSQKKTSFKRAKIASFSAGKPKANSQPTFQFGAPEIKNQANGATNGHQPNFFTAPVPALVPTFQSNNPKLNFNAVPSLAPQNSSGQVFFFGAAATNNGGYNGQLPPAFDPAVLRQQYNSGGSTAGNYWDELKPIGWNADPGLTKEENDADRVNYNIQKRTDTMNRERELRNQEIAEEKTWKPVFKPNGAMGNAKVGFRL